MHDLRSAPIPPLAADDHVRGEGELLIVYSDLGCPHCAATWAELHGQPWRIVFRHFPVRSKHPRSPALHAAAEAAGLQGAFFELVDSLYADRGHVDDPHLWQRVERLGLDLDRFEADRRSEAVAARVRRDFESGIRGGVAGTPAFFDAAGGSVNLSGERER
ncbi:MAG TPA: DsbA family protein, partial [Solirubrobacterales bacterium]|nr:DsbA family protein [Solirubrobacterales bacterium]